MSKATRTRKPYDPGTAGEIINEGNGKYLVESFRKPGEFYSVDAFAETCTCPNHIVRGRKCKHLSTVEESRRKTAFYIATGMSEEELYQHARRTDLRPEARWAVETVIHHRYL